MKKLFMVVQRKDAQNALQSLREFGEVHVENQQTPFGQDLILLREDVKNIDRVLIALDEQKGHIEQKELDKDWANLIDDAVDAIEGIEKLEEIIVKRKARIDYWESWGDFDPDDIARLREKGLFVKLCEINPKDDHQIPDGVCLEKISTSGNIERVVAIADHDFGLPFDNVALPLQGLKTMKQQQSEDEAKLEEHKQFIKDTAQYRDALKSLLDTTQEELDFQEVLSGMGKNEDLVYLKGYCPEDQVPTLQARAQKENWALVIDAPSGEDQVPTLLRNPQWVQTLKPLLGFMNILPGYSELDSSRIFLLFFSFFTGMLIGDAGYGVIGLILTFIAYKKVKGKIKDLSAVYLFFALSGSVVLWGVLTGTYFGQEWLPGAIKPVIPWLSETKNIMLLCFLVGAVHLSIAHIWRIILKSPSLSALGEAGIFLLLWYVFFLVRFLILQIPFPVLAPGLLGLGLVLTLFFSSPNKNPLKAILPGLGALYNGFMNSFTDTISYIRLFAVGLASVKVADAFNTIAMDIGFEPAWKAVFAVLVLFSGHTLNLVLCLMGVLVHGVRLNLLEFSSHLGVEWKGNPFKPFKKIQKLSPIN